MTIHALRATPDVRSALRDLAETGGMVPSGPVLMLLDDMEALLAEIGDARLALVPRVAPDPVFDAAWETLRSDRFARVTSRLSIHDARVLFRAVWSAMIGAVNPQEAARVEALRAAAAAISIEGRSHA